MQLKQEVKDSWPPGGWIFFQPETNWHAPTPLQLTRLQQAKNIQSNRRANPRFKLDATIEGCLADLDGYTCARLKGNPKFCVQDEATAMAVSGAEVKKKDSLSFRPQKSVAAVAAADDHVDPAVLREWLGDGAVAVPLPHAESRASVCTTCPQNVRAGWRDLLTSTAAAGIKVYVGIKNKMKLATRYDEELGVCKACRCVLTLKVWVPPDYIKENTDQATMAKLDPRCWVLKEIA